MSLKAEERYLVEAVKNGDVEDTPKGIGVASLLKRGVNVNCLDGSGCTPLHYACSNGKLEVARVLLNQPGILVNQKDHYGRTPLHFAALAGHVDITQLVMQMQGDKNALTNVGQTPYELAQANGHTPVCMALQGVFV
eukprot:NODE_6062_length_577_cov_20.406667_g5897_i0.p1 GENE.NODE_6062_length_577_cov_20.406667_g5897_i0~~NODE_6062_length_577_cov_20.406667_g5897_i0.p1  ORF type:complete len:137 (+),score=39.12 NODE_6062_length_577_cov_20.406667_g5897_i0:91-501(+)